MLEYETDNIPEGMESFYVKHEETGKFRLNVKGVVPETDVVKLKENLKEFRSTNNTLKQQLEELGDFEQVVGAKEGLGRDGVKTTIEKLVGARVTEMKSKYENDLSDKEKALASANSLLENLLITEAVKTAAILHGVEPTAVDDVLERVRKQFKIENGKAISVNSGGDEQGNPLTVDTFVASLKTKAKHLFPTSSGTGTFQRSRGSNPTQPVRSTGARLADFAASAKARKDR